VTARRGRGLRLASALTGVAAAGAVLLVPGSSAAAPREAAQPAPGSVVQICVDAHLAVLGVVVADLGVALQVGGGPGCAPAPTTTTTTAPPPPPTTTTTRPPPPPPPPVTTTIATSTTTTTTSAPPQIVAPTTTASTTTSTTTVPPPEAPPTLEPRLALRVSLSPDPPAAGEPVTATIEILNRGGAPVPDVTLVDEVSPTADVRSATTWGGSCTTTARQATCGLGTIPAGDRTTADVRLQVAEQPASRTIVQRISLSTDGAIQAGGTTVSNLLAAETSGPSLLSLPGPTVTLVAFVGFVLAASASSR
jgi:uncharacterized protein DUF11